MKKTLVAIAVSSAAVSSMTAYAAEDTSNFDVYGNVQLVYVDGEESGSEITDNGSTFGFQGSTAINDDLTGYFKYELEVDADDKGNNSNLSIDLDQAYIGLQGNFGKVQVGSFDTIYNNAIQDDYNQTEALGLATAEDSSEGDTIAYFSPNVSGFEFQLAAQVKGDAESKTTDQTSTTTVLQDNIPVVQTQTTAASENDSVAMAAVLKYSVDALTVAVAYDSVKNIIARDDIDSSTMGVNVQFQLTPALALGVTYEDAEDVAEIMSLNTRYNYGMGDVYATYQQVDQDEADDFDTYAVGATYNLASNMYVYGEYGRQDTAEEDNVTAVGATYLF